MVNFNGAATLSLRKRIHRRHIIRPGIGHFNGAATLSLRKPYGRRQARPSVCHFNGAATLSLRKYVVYVMSLGWEDPLQWGRNFIVAEMIWGQG